MPGMGGMPSGGSGAAGGGLPPNIPPGLIPPGMEGQVQRMLQDPNMRNQINQMFPGMLPGGGAGA